MYFRLGQPFDAGADRFLAGALTEIVDGRCAFKQEVSKSTLSFSLHLLPKRNGKADRIGLIDSIHFQLH